MLKGSRWESIERCGMFVRGRNGMGTCRGSFRMTTEKIIDVIGDDDHADAIEGSELGLCLTRAFELHPN